MAVTPRRGGNNAGTIPAGRSSLLRMKSTPPPLPADLFWEARTAESLGISRTVMRALRKQHLTPVVDWQLIENAVVLTASGVGKISAVLRPLGAPSPAAAPGPAVVPSPAVVNGGGLALPPGPPLRRKFMVTRKPVFRSDAPQRKIVLCSECAPDAKDISSLDLIRLRASLVLGTERPIRVRDNLNFAPGMVLEAVAIGHGIWQYLGRLPRRLGRW